MNVMICGDIYGRWGSNSGVLCHVVSGSRTTFLSQVSVVVGEFGFLGFIRFHIFELVVPFTHANLQGNSAMCLSSCFSWLALLVQAAVLTVSVIFLSY